ncbi:MAG: hypothetical protein KKA55_14380 [Proteobacteria bacterium]|nr:hypothetical protein [Pseudomonadota bacterium]MBU1596708.1 hypothetical protein [Pseudomonadota bacterium]
MTPDILIAWFNVHGGAFHKLLALHQRLRAGGLDCQLGFHSGPPRGLKVGADVPEALVPELQAQGVRLLSRAELLDWAQSARPRLLLTDAHDDPDLPGLLAQAKARGVKTAQMATLLGDFTSHGAEHLLMQHPLTLFFELEFNRTRESSRLAQAEAIHFTGNIFFEPTTNPLFGGFSDRAAFCAKYGYNPERPILLWLPSAPDAESHVYEEVCRAVEDAGLNLAIKLHPWDYALKKHGPHPGDVWGLGRPSDEVFGRRAVDEPDSSFAFQFCDAAILRTSAMSLELPFWERPGLLLPADLKPKLFEAQAHMARGCCVSLGGVDALERMLVEGALPSPRPQDYQRARDAVRLPGPGDAYERTIAALRGILGLPDSADGPPALLRPDGRPQALGRAYEPFVDDMLARALTPSRRLRYEFGCLRRWLAA